MAFCVLTALLTSAALRAPSVGAKPGARPFTSRATKKRTTTPTVTEALPGGDCAGHSKDKVACGSQDMRMSGKTMRLRHE